MWTISVLPMHQVADEPWFTYQRPLERWMLRGMTAEKVVLLASMLGAYVSDQPEEERVRRYQQVQELSK